MRFFQPRMGLTALLLIVSATGRTPVQGQEPFRAGTTLIPVDVRVVDRDGRPVTDLTARDFTILEEGKAQPIVQFSTQAFTPEPPPAVPLRPRRAADAYEQTAVNQRTFLIVLGRGNLQPPSDGVDAVLHFFRERLFPQDLAAVLAWNRATDFTSERTSTLELLERFKLRQLGIELQILDWSTTLAALYSTVLPAYIQRNIDDVFGGPMAGNQRTLGSQRAAMAMHAQTLRATELLASGRRPSELDRLELGIDGQSLDEFMAIEKQVGDDVTKLFFGVEYLRHMSGEKHLVFFSESGVVFRMADQLALARAASDARVVLDIVHTGGIAYRMSNGAGARNVGRPLPPTGGTMQTAITARMLTSMTGGRFFANKFPKATADVDMIEQSTRFSYVLGYAPTSQNWDGRYRPILVKVNRPGLTVLHRNGYYARRELGPLDRRSALVRGRVAAAAEEPRIIPDLPLSGNRAVIQGTGANRTVNVTMTIDLTRVEFDKRDGRNVGSLDVAAFAVKGRTTVGQEWTTLDLTYTDERLAQVRRDGLPHTITVSVSNAADAVKIVAYNYDADLVGSAVAKVR